MSSKIASPQVGFFYETSLVGAFTSCLGKVARAGDEVEDLYQGTDMIISSGGDIIRVDFTLRSKVDVEWSREYVTLGGIPHQLGFRHGNGWVDFDPVVVIKPTLTHELDRLVGEVTKEEIWDALDSILDFVGV